MLLPHKVSHFVGINSRSAITFRGFVKCPTFTSINFCICDRFEIFCFGIPVKICNDRLAFSNFALQIFLFDEEKVLLL